MKTLNIISSILILFVCLTISSCSSDDSPELIINTELAGLVKVQDISNETHTIELYAKTGALEQGYNALSLRIKNKATGTYETPAAISIAPLMHMTMMSHSCPKSEIKVTPGKTTLYNGFVVFQMAQNDTEYWELTVNYTIDGTDYTATAQINVPASTKQRVTSFTGSDGTRYILALIDPETPRATVNDMTAAIFKMESMLSFPIVDGYAIKLDPRMPGMGNHGSPNNVDLTQSATDHLYHGKLSLTMTGYWRINLQLLNASGEVLKGEAITPDVPQSSVYFETEF